MADLPGVDLRVREPAGIEEEHAAADLLARVWGADDAHQPVDASFIRALTHTGNYVAGAYAGTELTGVSVGFFADDGHLHSHITGVLPGFRGRSVGFALKLHQRSWAMARGISEIHWTADPLVGRNSYFNLHKLGARATAYLPDFYGVMDDGINGSDATDRLYLVWRLDTARVVAAVAGDPFPVPEAVLGQATTLVGRDGDEPVSYGVPSGGGPALLVALPPDIEALRAADPMLAARWRLVVREAVQDALAGGYTITGISRDGRYVLEET